MRPLSEAVRAYRPRLSAFGVLQSRPNEAIFWAAIQYWRERGMAYLDLGGGGAYKRKYGPREVRVPHLRASRFPGLSALRALARFATEQGSALRGRRRRRQDVPPTRTL